MITVKALLGKLNSLAISDERMIEASLAQINHSRIRCPRCGAIGRCRPIGSYKRMMITVVDGARHEVELEVPRVQCDSCRHTHALLADILVPYGSYALRFILHILNEYIHRGESVARLCERWAISIATLYGWIHLFRKHYNLWFRIMEQIDWVTQDALARICDIPEFPSAFFAQFRRSFLRKPATRFHPTGRGGGLFFTPSHNCEIDY